MDIKIFEQFININAGFTTKPDKSDVRREEMAALAAKTGKCVIRPCLVHGDVILPITKDMIQIGAKEAEEYFFSKNSWTKSYAYPHTDFTKLYLDLKGINTQFILQYDINNIEVSSECTYCNENKFYSYRRSKDTDRMLAYIEITN